MSKDFMLKFSREYHHKLGRRDHSFKRILEEACRRKPYSIVETGSLREPSNWLGDGQSTIILNEFAKMTGAEFTTIDVDPKAIENAVAHCPEAQAICKNSIEYLSQRVTPIDFLYLDANGNKEDDALHCFFEFCAAKHLLKPGSILVADDSPADPNWVTRGKGMYLANFLRQIGIKPFTLGYQTAWIMK